VTKIGIDSFVAAVPDALTGENLGPADRLKFLLDEIEFADRVGLDVFGVGEHVLDWSATRVSYRAGRFSTALSRTPPDLAGRGRDTGVFCARRNSRTSVDGPLLSAGTTLVSALNRSLSRGRWRAGDEQLTAGRTDTNTVDGR
jgi:hypothetical protein